MMEKLQWTKDLFGRNLEIRRGEELVGSIRWEGSFGTLAQALIYGKLFVLTRDFFLSKIEIYDANDQSLLGMVMINLFNPRSDVVINGKRFELVIHNFWQSHWSWRFNGEKVISYHSNSLITKGKGEIELFTTLNEEVEVLILLGLFVRNQFAFIVLFLLLIILLIFI